MSQTKQQIRLVLDTCAVRNLLHGNGTRPDCALIGQHTSEVKVSIPDPAFAEVISALFDGRVSWTDWTSKAGELKIVDQQLPILPGHRQLGDLAGGKVTPDDQLERHCFGWQLLLTATSLGEVKAGRHFINGTGKQILVNLDSNEAARIRCETHQNWIDFITNLKNILSQSSPSKQDVERIVRAGFEPIPGLPLDRLDSAVRFLAYFVNQSLKKRNGYNPSNRPSDAFDFDLLYALALPEVVICTAEQRLPRLLSQEKSLQAGRVIRPDELNQRLKDGTLHQLV